ncbi:transcription initiation factor IID, 18kD subunit-domain-containing protein [Pseudoneurospora amorphoporcata]|uniref:Transcription initiation factor IID, 18kD subunit-domain-containing protein n=1 Tax=Pseudoneurospora amorphoporcata TaxID=241081 RepID=A0AAN6NLN1_9PEZI|nr:transcription initiation factor IID, 18kD subunit-domain-containing protein [Pseudoneurospora amorphoporcata]
MSISSVSEPLADSDVSKQVTIPGTSTSHKATPGDDTGLVHGSKRERDSGHRSVAGGLSIAADRSCEPLLGALDNGPLPSRLFLSKCSSPPYRPLEVFTSLPNHLARPDEGSGSETQQLDQSAALKKALENIVKAQAILEQVQVTAGSESQNIATGNEAGPASVLPPEVAAQSRGQDQKSATGCPSSEGVPDDAVDTFRSSCNPSDDRTKTINSAEVWFSAQDRTSQPVAVDVESKDFSEEPCIPEDITPDQPSELTSQSDDALLDTEWDEMIDNEIIIPLAPSQQDTVMGDASTSSSLPTSSFSVNQVGDGLDLFQDAFDNALDEINTENQAKRPYYPIPNDIFFPSSGAETEERRGINNFVGPYPKDPWESYWKKRAETKEQFIARFTNNVRQMMYVSGETGEPSVETTSIIEDIVRQQVISMLKNCTELAARRGSRSITINDLIFQIRDDAPKVSRLRTFLSWKDVRKNVKDSEDKGGDADIGAAGEDPSAAAGIVPGAGGPVDDAAKKNKKAKVGLPWEPSSFYAVEVPEREDEEDEEEEEMNYITLQRLRKADERTKAMTREEYVTWSEFRQASFTYRKGKRFREWAGFGQVTDSKPSDDIVDILGFLTFEMVQSITEEALKIKDHEDLLRTGEAGPTKKRKLPKGLFDPPGEGRTPVEPRHIHEAFRRLQDPSKKRRAMLNGTRLQPKTDLLII